MKIVITGATSFTGKWFVNALHEQHHELWTLIHQERAAYTGLRKERLLAVEGHSTPLYSTPFGSENFFSALEAIPSFDLFCHHAADVTDYKSPNFNPVRALEKNTRALPEVLKLLKKKGCRTLILTGSVFEQREGEGSDDLRAVSPYGLSKGMTADAFSFYCQREGILLKKFVIPNPFGPFEEERFTTFLAKTWLQGKVAPVTMPDYVRDNIPVTLLAKAYAAFAVNTTPKLNPSGFVEAQGTFVHRFQKELKKRLSLPCEFEIKTQTDFNEPLIRINTDALDKEKLGWNEEVFWDSLANFYRKTYG